MRLSLPLSAAALCLAVAAPSGAYTLSEARWSTSALPVQYRVNPATAPSTIGAAGAVTSVDQGFASWSAPACTSWRTTNAGTTSRTRGVAGDRENSILWISGTWPSELGPVDRVIGVTTPVYNPSTRLMIDADIQFNNVGFTWSLTGVRGTVDTVSIATHEEGHFLGLDHSANSAAVMYASYPGGIKRDLTGDDIAGVCTLYPLGVTIPDAGVVDAGSTADPCNRYTSCAGCTPVNGCGWCGASNSCVTSTASGPVGGSCASGFRWLPSECGATTVDAGTSTDPCARFAGGGCNECTQYDGCGWCPTQNRCVSGTRSGPGGGACSGWAWFQTECRFIDAGTTTPTDTGPAPTSAFGEPCTATSPCSTGGICVRMSASSAAFCTRGCADDCTCPRGYSCAGRISTGQTVCVPGANRCADDSGTSAPVDVVMATDSGVVIRDSGTPVINDAGTPSLDAGTPGTDAGMTMKTQPDAGTTTGADDAGDNMVYEAIPAPGCGCRTGSTPASGRSGALMALAAVGLALSSRRRRR